MANFFLYCIAIVNKSAAELVDILSVEVVNCTQLGIHLKLPLPELKKLETQSMDKKPPIKCFGEMCHYWLQNNERKTWQVVYTALDQRSNKRLAQHLKDNYGEDGDKIGMKILMILFL